MDSNSNLNSCQKAPSRESGLTGNEGTVGLIGYHSEHHHGEERNANTEGPGAEQNCRVSGDDMEGQHVREGEVVVKMEEADCEEITNDAADVKLEMEAEVQKPAKKPPPK